MIGERSSFRVFAVSVCIESNLQLLGGCDISSCTPLCPAKEILAPDPKKDSPRTMSR